MGALHSPHIDKLCTEDDDDDDDDDASIDEEAFREALGTRPPLPDSFNFDSSFRTVLEIFFAATNEDPEQRPTAREILEMLETKSSDANGDSILCVNMVKGLEDDSVIESDTTYGFDDSSVICIDSSFNDSSSQT